MATRKEQEARYGGLYRRKFRWINTCVYCGAMAQCMDHVFPISRMGNMFDVLNHPFRDTWIAEEVVEMLQ